MIRCKTTENHPGLPAYHPSLMRYQRVAYFRVTQNEKGRLIWVRHTADRWHDTDTDRGLANLNRDLRDEPDVVYFEGVCPLDIVTAAQARKLSGLVGSVGKDWVQDNF